MTDEFRFSSLLRQGSIYGAGIVLSKAVGFLMLPIYTRYLTPADYGVLQLVTMTIEVVSILAGSRLIGGVFRFYHKAELPADRDAVIASAVVLLGVLYLAAAAGASLYASTLSTYLLGDVKFTGLVRIAALTLALDGLALVPMALLQLRGMSGRFVMANTARLFIGLSCNLLFVVHFRMGAEGVLISSAVASAVLGIVLFTWVARHVGLRPRRAVVSDLLRFGLPFVAMQLATFLSAFGDRYFINASAGTEAVGLYALAYQFAFLYLALAFAPLMTAWQPIRFRVSSRSDRDSIYADAFTLASIVLLVAGAAVALFAEPTIRLMAAPPFHAAGRLVPVLVFAYMIQAWTELVSTGLLVSERTGLIARANYAALFVALAGYAAFVPTLHATGAAWVTLGAFFARFVLVYRFSQRAWPIRYKWRPVLLATTACVLIVATASAIPSRSLLVGFSIRAVMFVATLAAIWFLAIPDSRQRSAIMAYIRHPGRLLHAIRSAGA